jgi:hypothetical protein
MCRRWTGFLPACSGQRDGLALPLESSGDRLIDVRRFE